MREAIYESHGIMTNADKNSIAFQGQKNQNSLRKARRFASGGVRHNSVNIEKLTVCSDGSIGNVDDISPAPLTVRNIKS